MLIYVDFLLIGSPFRLRRCAYSDVCSLDKAQGMQVVKLREILSMRDLRISNKDIKFAKYISK